MAGHCPIAAEELHSRWKRLYTDHHDILVRGNERKAEFAIVHVIARITLGVFVAVRLVSVWYHGAVVGAVLNAVAIVVRIDYQR